MRDHQADDVLVTTATAVIICMPGVAPRLQRRRRIGCVPSGGRQRQQQQQRGGSSWRHIHLAHAWTSWSHVDTTTEANDEHIAVRSRGLAIHGCIESRLDGRRAGGDLRDETSKSAVAEAVAMHIDDGQRPARRAADQAGRVWYGDCPVDR